MNKVFIIAEAGVNHNGSIELAKRLIDVAVEAGVDAVKFQTFKASELVLKNAQKASYQKEHTSECESQYKMLKKLELSEEDHLELIEYCNQKGIMFLSTAFDLKSINLLNQLDMKFFKVPSGEITNIPYLKAIGKLGKKVILSTGMSNLEEIEQAVNVLKESGSDRISVLHCNTEYPTPMEDVNLKAMLTIRDKFQTPVGYSDHTLGIEVPIAAVAMGATIIEKHFTLDHQMEGPDHKASLEPQELKQMVKAIRNIEKAMGDGIKKVSKSEIKNTDVVRKSIVASMFIKKGDVFSEQNLTTKRPGIGLSPLKWNEVIGTKATRDYEKDELIKL